MKDGDALPKQSSKVLEEASREECREVRVTAGAGLGSLIYLNFDGDWASMSPA